MYAWEKEYGSSKLHITKEHVKCSHAGAKWVNVVGLKEITPGNKECPICNILRFVGESTLVVYGPGLWSRDKEPKYRCWGEQEHKTRYHSKKKLELWKDGEHVDYLCPECNKVVICSTGEG